MLAQTNGFILHTSVTIGYGEPWRKVHGLLIDAALKTQYILQHPAPFVLQNALQDSYVQYQINAYTHKPRDGKHLLCLHANIQDSFFACGVEIMSPIYSALRDGNQVAIPSEFLPPTRASKVSGSSKKPLLPPPPARSQDISPSLPTSTADPLPARVSTSSDTSLS